MNILSASFWLDQSSRLTRDYGYIIMVTLLPPEPPMSLLCYMPEKSKFFENVSFPCFLKKYTYSVHVWLTFSIGQGPFIEWEIFNCSCTNLKMEFLIIITNHKENREYVFHGSACGFVTIFPVNFKKTMRWLCKEYVGRKVNSAPGVNFCQNICLCTYSLLLSRVTTLAWACNPVVNHCLASLQLQKNTQSQWALNLSLWYGHVILVSS